MMEYMDQVGECWDFISPASSIINRRRDSEYGPHHSINLGTRIHAPNHVHITTPCSVHVPSRLSDGESLLKQGRTLTGRHPKPAISFQFSKHHPSGDCEGIETHFNL